jgi:hypothetical protein
MQSKFDIYFDSLAKKKKEKEKKKNVLNWSNRTQFINF